MPLSDVQKAALNRLQSFYEGDNPYNSVTNPGGFRQNGHLYNFVPALKDIATVITGVAALAVEVATNSVQSPKAVRVDADQNYTEGEKAQGQKNLGIAATLAAAVSKLGDTMTGALNIRMPDAQLTLLQNGGSNDKLGWRLLNFNLDARLYFQAIAADGTGTNPMWLNRDGSLNLSAIGDVSARIEARAAAFAALRVAKTGDTMTGTLGAPNFNTTKGSAGGAFGILSRDASGKDFQLYNAANLVRFWESTAGDVLRLGADGGVWTLQLGDLNARIESRGSAYGELARTAAQAASVAKAGDTMSGKLQMLNAPVEIVGTGYFDLVVGNVYRWRNIVGSDGTLAWKNGDTNGDNFTITTGGAIWCKQFGDLNARIEARAAAYGALAVQKTGDTMTGDLTMSGTVGSQGLGIRFLFPSNADWVLRSTTSNRIQFCDGAKTAEYASIGVDGSASFKQIGDLNTRIETRAKAFADAAQTASYNAAVAACQQSTRLVYAGDLGNSWNLGGGYTEPYAGAVMTTRYTYTESDGTWNFGGARWRYLQMYVPNAGGWVTAGYA